MPNALDVAAQWSWRLLLIAAAIVAVVFALSAMRLLILPLIVAAFTTTLLAPLVERLAVAVGNRTVATTITMVASLAVVGGLIALIAPPTARELGELGETVRQGIDESAAWIEGTFDVEVAMLVERASEYLRENAGPLGGRIVTGALLALELIAGILLSIVIMFFFLRDGSHIVSWARSHIPPERRAVADAAGNRVWDILGRYLAGVAVVGIVDAGVIGIGLVVIGVPLVLPLMLLTFLSAFLPLVGAVLAGLAAALVALAANGPVDALFVLGVVVAVQQLEGDLVAPAVMGRAVALHPLAILLALTAGGIVGGVIGAALSVPLVAITVAIFDEVRRAGPTVDGDEVPIP